MWTHSRAAALMREAIRAKVGFAAVTPGGHAAERGLIPRAAALMLGAILAKAIFAAVAVRRADCQRSFVPYAWAPSPGQILYDRSAVTKSQTALTHTGIINKYSRST